MKRKYTAETISDRMQQLFDGLRASEGMDLVAGYLNRGRTLSKSSTETLEARWRGVLRLRCSGGDFDPAIEDIYAELTLRGIDQVELPQDLVAMIVAHYEHFREEMDSNSELRMALYERIFKFAETLRTSMN
jgi:hypothetical protein